MALDILGGMVGLCLGLLAAVLVTLNTLKLQLAKHLEYMIAADNEHRLAAKSNQEYLVSLISELKPPQPRQKNGEFAGKPKNPRARSMGEAREMAEAGMIGSSERSE